MRAKSKQKQIETLLAIRDSQSYSKEQRYLKLLLMKDLVAVVSMSVKTHSYEQPDGTIENVSITKIKDVQLSSWGKVWLNFELNNLEK
jgi:hypothetical protein